MKLEQNAGKSKSTGIVPENLSKVHQKSTKHPPKINLKPSINFNQVRQNVLKKPTVNPSNISTQSTKNSPKIHQKSTKNLPKIHQKSIKMYQHKAVKTHSEPTQNPPKIHPKPN